eukprot:GHVL01035617.1.p1 GENE.GHVL01035617.1~~GHVL01035617.1.p1  ORF type:complete len:155 (-),score=19.28 GHVL01035617.1:22-420(-)
MLAGWLQILPSKDIIIQLCNIQCECFKNLPDLTPSTAAVGRFKLNSQENCQNQHLFSDKCCENLRKIKGKGDNLAISWGILSLCEARCNLDDSPSEDEPILSVVVGPDGSNELDLDAINDSTKIGSGIILCV